METYNQILIVGRPGHFRDSLAAVLKTLPGNDLFLAGGLETDDLEQFTGMRLTLILADLDLAASTTGNWLSSTKRRCPNLLSIALVDNAQQSRIASSLGVDYVLSRSASAGELLRAIQHLLKNPAPNVQRQSYYARFAFSG